MVKHAKMIKVITMVQNNNHYQNKKAKFEQTK